MNKRAAQRLNDVALNIIDLVHCLHTGAANEISYERWRDMFASGKQHEAARKQWRGWKRSLMRYDLCETVKDGREDHVILKPRALEVAEGLRAEAQAVLNQGQPEKRRYPDQVTIGGRTFRLKVYGRAVRPLTDREYADLRESIEAAGRVEVAVVVDRRGNVVDGKHRLMIADELRLDRVPVKVEESDDEETLEKLAEDLNGCRRQYTRQQLAEWRERRQERAEAMRTAGMSLRQIAEEEGVTQTTIQKDLEAAGPDAPEKVCGKDGLQRPARKSTREEAAERRRQIAELLVDDEYGEMTAGKIAELLRVSPRTVQRDIQALARQDQKEDDEEALAPPKLSIVVQEVVVGERSWLGVDREADPLGTCLEVASNCLRQLRERIDDPELLELAVAAHEIVESAIWRLMEGAAA